MLKKFLYKDSKLVHGLLEGNELYFSCKQILILLGFTWNTILNRISGKVGGHKHTSYEKFKIDYPGGTKTLFLTLPQIKEIYYLHKNCRIKKSIDQKEVFEWMESKCDFPVADICLELDPEIERKCREFFFSPLSMEEIVQLRWKKSYSHILNDDAGKYFNK